MQYLSWNYRSTLIYEQLNLVQPDVVCLQGVDHYKDLLDALGPSRYQGVYSTHPHSRCLKSVPNNGPDGICIIYKRSLLELVCSNTISLPVTNKEMDPSNQIAILAQFRFSGGGHDDDLICIVVTQLKSGHLFAQTRLLQVDVLLEEIKSFSKDVPLILCGNFNADSTEPVYGHISSSKPSLSSAYLTFTGREPLYTAWKSYGLHQYKCTVDYIWYSSDKRLQVIDILQLPLDVHDQSTIGLPYEHYPSYHLAIGAKFMFNL